MGQRARRYSRQTQQKEWKELHEYCDRIDRRGAANARTKSEKPGSSTTPRPPLPGPGPSSFEAATRRPHFQAAQTKAENARKLNHEENDRPIPHGSSLQMKRGLSFTILALLSLFAGLAMAMDNNWSGAALGCVAAGCLFFMAIV